MRILIFGNSGSGKSTFAKSLAEQHDLARLDLDSIVWEPSQIAVERPRAAVRESLLQFINENPQWVIEGCYGELIEEAIPYCTLLVFMNQGLEACLSNNERRPWEPHKYTSLEEQNKMLANLQAWVAGYYERDDPWSYAYHRRIFDAHTGEKREIL